MNQIMHTAFAPLTKLIIINIYFSILFIYSVESAVAREHKNPRALLLFTGRRYSIVFARVFFFKRWSYCTKGVAGSIVVFEKKGV